MPLNKEFTEWQERNKWFGHNTKKSEEFVAIGKALRCANCTLTGTVFLHKCEQVAQFIDEVKNEVIK